MAKPPATRQLPLEFDHDPASGRDDLIVSDRLNAAVAIVDRWPDWPSPVVILAGPTGSGKSHLARIWANRVGATRIDIDRPDPMVLETAARMVVTRLDQLALARGSKITRALAAEVLAEMDSGASDTEVS